MILSELCNALSLAGPAGKYARGILPLLPSQSKIKFNCTIISDHFYVHNAERSVMLRTYKSSKKVIIEYLEDFRNRGRTGGFDNRPNDSLGSLPTLAVDVISVLPDDVVYTRLNVGVPWRTMRISQFRSAIKLLCPVRESRTESCCEKRQTLLKRVLASRDHRV